jgi:hypothetical protein
MKNSVKVRAALSAVATAFTVAANLAISPVTTLMSGNAALRQVTHSDASYVSAVAEMNAASMLAGMPGAILLVALCLIWGSLLFKKNR